MRVWNSYRNQGEKALEDALVKVGSGISTCSGFSGRVFLDALVDG